MLPPPTAISQRITPHPRRLAAGMNQGPKTLAYNPAENALLVTCDADGGSFELYAIPKDSRGDASPEAKRGLGSSAVFIARNRFAVLDKAAGAIQVRTAVLLAAFGTCDPSCARSLYRL